MDTEGLEWVGCCLEEWNGHRDVRAGGGAVSESGINTEGLDRVGCCFKEWNGHRGVGCCFEE